LFTDLSSLGEIKAPVHVNIEIDKTYKPYIFISFGANMLAVLVAALWE
jgi:hypothetical protein